MELSLGVFRGFEGCRDFELSTRRHGAERSLSERDKKARFARSLFNEAGAHRNIIAPREIRRNSHMSFDHMRLSLVAMWQFEGCC